MNERQINVLLIEDNAVNRRLAQLFGQGWHKIKQVERRTVLGDAEDRCRRIRVDGNDGLGVGDGLDVPDDVVEHRAIVDRLDRHLHALLDRDGAGAAFDRTGIGANAVDGDKALHGTAGGNPADQLRPIIAGSRPGAPLPRLRA